MFTCVCEKCGACNVSPAAHVAPLFSGFTLPRSRGKERGLGGERGRREVRGIRRGRREGEGKRKGRRERKIERLCKKGEWYR